MRITDADKLFKSEVEQRPTSIENNTENNLRLYSEGYKEAGNVLYEFCIENQYYENWILFPLVFNYRHYIELKLKELIFIGKSYLGEEREFPTNEHGLLRLWRQYRNDVLAKIDNSIEQTILDNIEKLITEFNQKDSKSMKFRYPINKNDFENRSLEKPYFDVVNFKDVMDKIINFFNEQTFIIQNYQEMEEELMSSLYWE
ncbi:hypothetical protein [Maribacter litoralis]|uniref:hypothetical protein n=1 Tax=Maribacter litoralis TaxID=2059726 RepID=UPI000E30B834|nr:hypothetical protein [Maribacter litoralis]